MPAANHGRQKFHRLQLLEYVLKVKKTSCLLALRNWPHELSRKLHASAWFPQVPLALLLAAIGIRVLYTGLLPYWPSLVYQLEEDQLRQLMPALLMPVLVGVGTIMIAVGLLLRSRLAWIMAVLLSVATVVAMLLGARGGDRQQLYHFVFIIIALLLSRTRFDRNSLTGATLFALTALALLVLYATLGSFYMGTGFHPNIHDLFTAFYNAVVIMTTVGYGDYVPVTVGARAFAMTVMTLGIAIFGASITAIVAPAVSKSMRRAAKFQKGHVMKRENHIVVIGASPLADNACHELSQRKQKFTRIVRPEDAGQYDPDPEADLLIGDADDQDLLRTAGVDKASTLLVMGKDDASNAFAVLAARELGTQARIIVAVQDRRNLNRIKLTRPDALIAPQILGGEIAAMLVCGEPISSEDIMQKIVQETTVSST